MEWHLKTLHGARIYLSIALIFIPCVVAAWALAQDRPDARLQTQQGLAGRARSITACPSKHVVLLPQHGVHF
jgi:hypothetical protein